MILIYTENEVTYRTSGTLYCYFLVLFVHDCLVVSIQVKRLVSDVPILELKFEHSKLEVLLAFNS